MLAVEKISKEEKQKNIKRIEFHLKNYTNYQVAIVNLKKKLELLNSSFLNIETSRRLEGENSEACMDNERNQLELELQQYVFIIEAIDNALENIEEVERNFIIYRYFNKWTIDKCALKIGYSDKTLFLIRNQVIKKFLISLGCITII
ncbi:transcriptional regulator [Bacillus paramycoides]|uniref:transcriptional regulator n=1 Tax=Bacillus paramycoides TaxID=2026194 RepID=UPI0015B965A3|nr:transcriptional regulator [Bacillus paramycoides]NWK71116.1 transcriptional regulator [Bacillus paramycoides]